MKCLVILCLILTGGSIAHGQLPGFPLHANGLLYSDTLMNRLKHLADSARSRPGPAGAPGNYYSIKQTTGLRVRVDTGDVHGAFDDLRKGISFAAFVSKYPQAEAANKILVLLDERPGYHVAGNATYYTLALTDYSASRIILPTDEHYRPITNLVHDYGINSERVGINGNCVYYLCTEPHTYRGKTTTDAYVFAYYLDSVPMAVRLPKSAARIARYRDLVVDSTIGVHYKNAKVETLDFRNLDFGPAQNAFDKYLDQRGDSFVAVYRPTHSYAYAKNSRMEDFQVKRRYLDSLSTDTVFTRLLAAAIAEVEEKNYYPFIYLDRYMDAYSPRAALEIRRRWIPLMMDNFDELRPRLDEMHIAYLAAELGNWPVFLRTQLSLAIDPSGNFPDSSRPGYRTNFLRELEELNIDVDDILLGYQLASLWTDQRFSGAKLLGRALALEGGDRHRIEETVLQLIGDKGLDVYHRLEMHYLFLNYESFLPAGPERSKAIIRLMKADSTLPDYLSATVKVQEQDVNNHASLPSW
jgi:hypothetical protein